MTRAIENLTIRLLLATSGERGQSIGSFSLVLLFAIVAGAIAAVLLMSGDIGGGQNPTVEAPNFEPPNPLD
jgi:hypothetical protein